MRSCLTISFSNKAASLFALIVGIVGCRFVASYSTPEAIVFRNALELKCFAIEKGLFCYGGNAGSIVRSNFFLSDHPADFDKLQSVCNVGDYGLTQAWRGILWVDHQSESGMTLDHKSVRGKWRVWGNVLVAGDEAMMDRIEELYRCR